MLHGIRVVDFSRLLPGPYATRVLVELGAEVIKIEAKEGGDYARWWPPLVGDPPVSGAFRELNAGKKSVALDLRDPGAVLALRSLIATADVLVDSYRPGTLAKMGLDPAALCAASPRLIYCAITGFGLTGPDAARAGHDVGYLARAGVLGLSGSPALPATLGIQVADVGASLVAISGILGALYRRERTGRGGFVDTSLVESGMAFGALTFGVAHAGEQVVRGDQLLDGSRPCYGVYACAGGGFLAVGALEPKFWRAFVEAIGLPHLADSGLDGGSQGAAVRAEVQAVLMTRTRDEWALLFRSVDACVEPVLSLEEAERDPHLRARGATHPRGFVRGPIRVGDAPPMRRSSVGTTGSPPPLVGGAAALPPAFDPAFADGIDDDDRGEPTRDILADAPGLGDHTREVLASLGLPEAEIARLLA